MKLLKRSDHLWRNGSCGSGVVLSVSVEHSQYTVLSLQVPTSTSYEPMNPVPRELNWLPVRQRTADKTALLVYKCIHGLSSHLAASCHTALVVPTWDPPVWISVKFHELGSAAVTRVSSSTVLLCGIDDLRSFHWTFSRRHWKCSSSELSIVGACASAAWAD